MSFSNPIAGSVRSLATDDPDSRFARIFEATSDVVAMTDEQGRLHYLNAAGRKLLGLGANDGISNLTLRSLHPEWAYQILLHEALPSAQSDGTWSGETALISAEGREIPVLQSVLAHTGKDGTLDFISTICRDISERKQKELERIEWANRYNAAIRASGQVVFDWDTVDDQIAYGDGVKKLTGFSPDEMTGGMERFLALIHPKDVQSFEDRLQVATMTRDPFDHTFRAIRKDGGEIILHAQGCFFLDRLGQIGRMVGFFKDVTKERMAERAIQLANERLEQRVAERTSDLAKANFELKNSAMRQAAISRLGQRALSGQPLAELMLEAAKVVNEMMPGERTSILEYDDEADVFRPLAEVGWKNEPFKRVSDNGVVTMSGHTIRAGEPVVCRDLGSETRFRVSDAVFAAGMKCGITVCIKAGIRSLGVLACFTSKPRDYSRDDASFVQTIANVLTAAIERHLSDENIRRARAEAEAANRAKSEFLSRMSHELRTPLNAILGFTQLLEMEERTDSQQESIDHISRAGRNLLDLINEVLDIARLESGRVQFHIEQVDVLELLREAIAVSAPVAARRSIRIQFAEMDEQVPKVMTDWERLKQVFQNLLSNGVKFNREGGSITISAARRDASVLRVSFTDTGAGISEDNLKRLFVPFQRLGTREGGTEGGTGLGLAICQRLMAGLGGRIGASSTLGAGSTFWVELPLAEETPKEPAVVANDPPRLDDAPAAPAQQIHKILYIEDDVANFYLLDRFLSMRPDIKLFSALQGSIGLDLAREHTPELILLDLNLPDMSGDNVLRAMRQDPATAGITVVAVTGDVLGDKEKDLRALGVNEILVKPYRLSEIAALLDRVLAGKS